MNSKQLGTLRNILDGMYDYTGIYKYINKKDQGYAGESDRPTLIQTQSQYSPVIAELIGKKKATPFKFPIYVDMEKDICDKHKYVSVYLINPKYVKPPKGLKPWGAIKGEKVPKGHYNINADKYNKKFAFGFTSWSKIIDTPVIADNSVKHLSTNAILGEILWELTFYGWSEEKHKESMDKLEERLAQSIKEIEEGECVELLPAKEGKWKIVVANNVVEDLNKIFKKKKK
jgi:hypothetical protein